MDSSAAPPAMGDIHRCHQWYNPKPDSSVTMQTTDNFSYFMSAVASYADTSKEKEQQPGGTSVSSSSSMSEMLAYMVGQLNQTSGQSTSTESSMPFKKGYS
jgi:hypothetical protein